jgi:ribosome-binding factor A
MIALLSRFYSLPSLVVIVASLAAIRPLGESLLGVSAFAPVVVTTSFLTQPRPAYNAPSTTITTSLGVYYRSNSGGGGSRRDDKSKRQERVGQLVRAELSTILHRGTIKGDVDGYLEDELRQRISVVNADLSPDLKQARISVSIRAAAASAASATKPTTPSRRSMISKTESDEDEDIDDDEEDDDKDQPIVRSNIAVDKRRAYAWLVKNAKPLRYTLAQRMSHMKSCPELSFVQVDVAAAVDVMYLIDKVSSGYKRDLVDTDFYYDDEDDDDDDEDDEDDFEVDDDDEEDDDDDVEDYDEDDDEEEKNDKLLKP